MKSYVQLANLAVYLVAGVFIIAKLANQSPWFFVTGLGAMMAVILLIFRDTLLSLVASVQLGAGSSARSTSTRPRSGSSGATPPSTSNSRSW